MMVTHNAVWRLQGMTRNAKMHWYPLVYAVSVGAAPCHDSITAEMSRRHNDANVLCLSADLLGEELIERMVRIWLETPFEKGRHSRRIEKIEQFENDARSLPNPLSQVMTKK
jgi:hypothetical protein